MHFLIGIVAAALVPIAIVLGLAALKPKSFNVERRARIQAPPERVFPLINNLRSWTTWSPYLKDPAMQTSYSGPEEGPGAIYTWSGNKEVGAGRIEIVDTAKPTRVGLKLDILRPIEGSNHVDFLLVPLGDETEVTWALKGRNPLMARLASVFLNMDKLIGADFERGLANLKAAAERR